MNMGNPLYNAFAMEQVTERERATISGLMGMSWNIGWTIGPYLSGYMQANPNYRLPADLCDHLHALHRGRRSWKKSFFQRMDDRQRRSAFLERMGIPDLTVGESA